jgi:acid phosphatase (class A)
MHAPFIINVAWTKTGANTYTVTKTRNTTDFPQINALQQLCEEMKNQNTSKLWRTRPRPYYYYGDWYKGSKDLKPNDASSYPSGHGYFAGLFGMCMMYIDPENAQAIKAMMDEWMECRLIVGAHWNTDLSAGWQLGTIAFSIAMNYPQFHDLVMDAKAELEAYRAEQETPTTVDQTQNEAPKATKVIESGTVRIVKGDYQYNTLGNIIR